VLGSSNAAVYKYNSSGVYQSVSFSVAAQETVPHGIAWDGTSFWVTGIVTDNVYKYNASGVYQDVSFSAGTTNPYGIVGVGTSLWVVDRNTRLVRQFTFVNGVKSQANLGAQNYVRVA
jgi:hypothetical protein